MLYLLTLDKECKQKGKETVHYLSAMVVVDDAVIPPRFWVNEDHIHRR